MADLRETGCARVQSATAPLLVVLTNLKYFPSTPRVYFGAGAFHADRRLAISASSTFN